MISKKTIFTMAITSLLILLSVQCETNQGNQIPYVRVDLHLNLFGELGNPAIGTFTTVNGGANGIVIYRESLDVFYAYDRTCTQWPDHNEATLPDQEVNPDEYFDGIFTCPDCKSQYLLLTEASPISGPAVFGLRRYYTVFDGSLLHIYN